ncbi:hypothetical protein L6452_23117 [Arctium lappa]|uniref:Uncharacterized protein n=1 Tax=Arctium lappa TaxID=4217 RepID=A0ACB9B127_ARCLA|nr:hypothetical protein L6452_23117 [Arctium lappa]
MPSPSPRSPQGLSLLRVPSADFSPSPLYIPSLVQQLILIHEILAISFIHGVFSRCPNLIVNLGFGNQSSSSSGVFHAAPTSTDLGVFLPVGRRRPQSLYSNRRPPLLQCSCAD